MSTAAQIAASRQNAQLSTGPRTPEGKTASSRNAVKLGLFTARDFVLPEDQPAYDALVDAFLNELNPSGPLEQTWALEIIRAAWRLERCSRIEGDLADRALDSHGLDPLQLDAQNEAASRTLAAVDRARAQAASALRRATAELRRIQTERQTRVELALPEPENLGLAEYSQCLKALTLNERGKLLARRNDDAATGQNVESFDALIARLSPPVPQNLPSAKQTRPAPSAAAA